MPGMLEKLEGCLTDVLAMLKEVKEAVSARQVADQCSAVMKVKDPATREGVAGRELSSGRVDG